MSGPILISRKNIADSRPGISPRENKKFMAHGPREDQEFPASDLIASVGLDHTIICLGCLTEIDAIIRFGCLTGLDAILRKYAVWCARQVEHLMVDDRSKAALDVAWRHANGEATDEELVAAQHRAQRARYAIFTASNSDYVAFNAAEAALGAANYGASGGAFVATRATRAALDASTAPQDAPAARAAVLARHEAKLRQILDAGEWVEDAPPV